MRTSMIFVIAFLLAAPVSAQMKQWTDDQGVVHYEQGPREAPKPVVVQLPPISENTPEPEFRKAVGERFEILQSHLAAYKENIRLYEIGYQAVTGRRPLGSDAPGLTTATKKIFEALQRTETVIMARNNSALPQWVKDNRDWRKLDKEFAR